MYSISLKISSVKKPGVFLYIFQDIIDDELDLEESHINLSSKTNQRSVCLFGGCYSGCLISDWFLAEPRELIHCLKK